MDEFRGKGANLPISIKFSHKYDDQTFGVMRHEAVHSFCGRYGNYPRH